MFDAALGEILQKRISSAQRQKAERRPLARQRFGEEAIHDFEGGAVAADREKVPACLARTHCAQFPSPLLRDSCLATSNVIPALRTRSSAALASLPHFPPPAAGFTIARKRSVTGCVPRGGRIDECSQCHHRRARRSLANLFGQFERALFSAMPSGESRGPR